MKKVHPSTKRAIIREHEALTVLRVACNGRTMIQISVAQLRWFNSLTGNTPLTIVIEPIHGTPKPEAE